MDTVFDNESENEKRIMFQLKRLASPSAEYKFLVDVAARDVPWGGLASPCK
ncbi:hypothetical protein G6M86_26325 (plasmid) [Agrobacterium tumefaciens]|uniref:Uncharacterized protein n=1 Tax=Agrobacterium tumefaciens TaxID=358 RepID=A0AAJ4N7Z0_AGRTU|nr:hypothetical protein G6M86_26325 [Agrobacterium tumefaciens]